jgi:hypothetical protein
MLEMFKKRSVLRSLGGLAALWLLVALAGAPLFSQVSVTTWRNDIARTGQNLNETILTPSNVNATQFGKLFSQAVDGYVYAQPLYMPNVTIGGASHNVVFVATENDSVYAFDADSNSGGNANPLWFASMLSTTHGAAAGATTVSSNAVGTDIIPQIGITGTPVIDPTSGTLFVVSATQEGTAFVQRLHALDITSGAEKFGGPVMIAPTVSGTGNGSSGGTLTFDPEWENQRPGLLLLNGIVYVGFASHGDNGPWHGWILGYNALTLQPSGVFCGSPNGVGSGLWMGGAGLAADVPDPVNHPYGRMFVATGNGDYTASAPYGAGMDFGDSVLNLDLTNGVPTITDEFTPAVQANLDANDGDQGAGGVVILPTQTTGSYPNLLVQAGKSGEVYVLDRDNLGGYNTSGDQVVQGLPYEVGDVGTWTAPAYWNGTVYFWAQQDTMKAFSLVNGQLVTPPVTSSETYGFPGANPSISANGTTNGIVWTIDSEGYMTSGAALLQAHDASNPATTLYSSSTNSARDNPGVGVKFTVPTVANGKVYVGTQTQISVFGLLNSLPTATAPVLSPVGETFNGSLQVSITDATTGALIYYTLDGTTPTVSSPVYSTPITITATTTVQAMAVAPGYLQSPISTESYTSSSQVVAPTFSPSGGTFTQAISVTVSDGTTGASIYYTTDGSTPTTSSTPYTGPIAVSASETLSAIAAETGLTSSPVVKATYTISTGGTTYINYPSNGFTATSLSLNNGPTVTGGDLQLTDGGTAENRSAWFSTPVPVSNFVTNFTFQQLNAAADGMTFAIQGNNANALGYSGGGLGYQSIPNSIAVKFDLYSNAGEGPDSTGLYTNGAEPTVPAIDLTPTGVNLHSGDIMNAQLVYDGTDLTLTLTDTVTNASATEVFAINIPGTVGGNTAYVGFTGATGGSTATQNVLSWNYVSAPNGSLTGPAFSPAAGSYLAPQQVTISDATSGASIYYTTDGTTPTTSSTLYSGPITVSATETVEAIAVDSGYASSPVSTAAYTISTVLPAPTFLPAGGTYTSPQTVAISDTAPGSTIYFTTDGTTPTTSSFQYSGAVAVTGSETLQAIAVETGYTTSPVGTAVYTLNTGDTGIDFPVGFSGTEGIVILNGSTDLDDSRLQLTNGAANEAGSAWFYEPVNVQGFTTDFSFQLSNPGADGFAFVIQGDGISSLGSSGPGLGYQGINNSVAIKFDFYNDAGEGSDSTGLYLNGVSPTVPAIDLSTSGINLSSDDTMDIHLAYNGTVLSMTITDMVTGATFSTNWTINIPATVGGNTAYVGFTGGTGTLSASQKILTWVYSVGSTALPVSDSPSFSPPGGSYAATQTVAISDLAPGATIYYTTDGSAPTTASTVYSAPITVSSSETLNAIAVESGYAGSAVASAVYTISPLLPAPTFSPVAGTYTNAQSVSISDATSGTTIYYTTDGSTPTTSSAVYKGAIPVGTSETLQAIAAETGYNNSPVATAAYTINAVLPAPTFSIAGGTYTTAQTVTILDTTTGVAIYYTTNGNTPTTSSTLYTVPISVSATETLEAIAVETGYTNSPVATAAYTISTVLPTPTFSIAGGTYTTAQTVAINESTPGATIHYTTNGNTPTTSSAVYSAPITVSTSETLEAIAIEAGYTSSAVASAVYTINPVLPAPTFSPGSGTYTGVQTVSINDATAGAAIYYTTNGTSPTTSSTLYGGPITVSASETLQAIAAGSGYTNSAVAAAAYTISVPSKITPAITVTPSSTTLSNDQSLSVVVAVSGGAGNPTPSGSVVVTSGGYSSATTALSNGSVSINIPAGALSTGVDTLTASYTPDSSSLATYNGASNTASVTVSLANYSVTAAAVTISPGASGTSQITVSSTTGYAGTVSLSCAVTASPTGATDLPTCTGGQTVTLSSGSASGTATVTVNTTGASIGALSRPKAGKGRGLNGYSGGAILALAVLLGIPAQRRKLRSFLVVLFALAALGGIVACGGTSSNVQTQTNPGTTAGTYTITVTGTGNDANKTTATGTFTLTVN